MNLDILMVFAVFVTAIVAGYSWSKKRRKKD
jgi:hypothetical protein